MLYICPCCDAKIKICSGCGFLKPPSSFATDRSNKCNDCRMYYNEKSRKAYQKTYYTKNKKRITAYARAFRLKDIAKARTYQRKWYRENPEKVKRYQKKYRDKQKALDKACGL